MSDPMIGQSIKRREDLKYVTGTGTYVDDVTLPGMLYAAFVRSPHAHARLLGVDTSKALEHPKGIDAVTGAEAYPLAGPMPVYSYRQATVIKKPDYRCLAHDRVRFVGEPVALVAAADRYAADDVAELVEVAYEPLEPPDGPGRSPQAGCAEAARQPGQQRGAAHRTPGRGHGRRLPGGRLRLQETLPHAPPRRRPHRDPWLHRSIQPRHPGADPDLLDPDPPHPQDPSVGDPGLPEFKIRVIAPDVGGGFGNKLQVPPEVVALCLMAIKTRRPVKWIETRRESLMAFLHSREQIHDVEIPVKRDGTILGIKSHEIVNAGGYLDARISGPSLGAGMWLPGPYMMKGFHVDIDVVMTNKCPYGAYRGFGSQMGALVIERSMDLIARQLGRDPVDLRKQNVIKETPYKTVTGHEFDSGDYMAGLEKALEMVDYPALREEQARLRKEGRHMGIGVAMAVEGAGWNTYTAAMAQHYVPTLDYATVTMRMDTSGNVKVLIGDVACGTSHATTAAQVAADATGLPIDTIEIVEGDTAVTPYDSGTRAARFSAVVLPAVAESGRALKQKVCRVGAHLLEGAEQDMEIVDGQVHVRGVPAEACR